MYRKKRKDKKSIVIVISLIIVLVISVFIYIMNKKSNLNPFEKIIKDTVLTIGSVITKPVSFISDKINESKEKNNLYEKYKDLEEKYNNIKNYEEEIDNLKQENTELAKLLEIQNILTDYDYVNATIVNREINFWYDTFTIDKGESSGIDINMAVVTPDGLLGKVIETSNLYSKVKLITSESLGQKISVRIKIADGKYVYGLLYDYDSDKKCFLIEGISENVDIPIGSTVKTTGMSDIFPKGIVIGKVEGIEKDNFDLTKIVEVKPSVDYDSFSYVTVLKRKEVNNE